MAAPLSIHLPQENRVVIPANWSRYLLPRRHGVGRSITPSSEASARALARESLDQASHLLAQDPIVIAKLETNSPFDGEDIRALGLSLHKLYKADKAQKAWVDWSVRELGLIETLKFILSVASGQSQTSLERRHDEPFYLRLRYYLAEAQEAEYEQALALTEAVHKESDSALGARICFLFPERVEWCEFELQRVQYGDYPLLLAAATTPEFGQSLIERIDLSAFRSDWCSNLLANFIDELGLSAGPLLGRLAQKSSLDSSGARTLARALACIPEETAFLTLQDLATEHKGTLEFLHSAAEQFPRLAVSCLSSQKTKAALIQSLFTKFPGLREACQAELSPEQTAFLTRLQSEGEAEPESAEPSDWPHPLREPRWLAPRTFKAGTLKVEPRLPEPTICWKMGERESWLSQQAVSDLRLNEYQFLNTLSPWQRGHNHTFAHLVTCPTEAGLELIESFTSADPSYIHEHIKAVIARWELDALPLIRKACRDSLGDILGYISPYNDAEFCLRAAEAYSRLKASRSTALDYLLRYPKTAALSLIPDCLGKRKRPQKWAQNALLALSLRGQSSAIEEAAREYGQEVFDALQPLLAMDELDNLPDKIPELPAWFHEATISKPLLLNSRKALAGEGLRNFVTMIAISKPGEVYAGVFLVADQCCPTSLSRFAWSLFEAWMAAGADSKCYWALHALGWLGDDEVVRKLTPLLKKWPGEGGHARAVQGLEVLTSLGTDIALMHLFGLSQKLKYKGLKQQASDRIRSIAEDRGLTTDELGDRLVPDLGLGEDGALTLNFGPREFVIGFDEKLKPVVRDASGKLRKSLPRPNKSDDPELGKAAFERFKVLKKDVKTVASQQLVRLETALVKQRRWSSEDFVRFFLKHPLVVHLARRLVWGLYDGETLKTLFRVAEDGTLADHEDREFPLPDALEVGLAHPLEIRQDQRDTWSEIFADYLILQPFAQLDREVFPFLDGEREATELTRFAGAEIESVRLLSLESKGWRRGEALDGGVVHWMLKELGQQAYVFLSFEDGLVAGDPGMFTHQTLRGVTLQSRARAWGGERELPFGHLSEAAFSEVIRDLRTLISS